MNEPNDFALARRPPSALEKSVPGTKRIISGMVAETLALAFVDLDALVAEGRRIQLRQGMSLQDIRAFTLFQRAAVAGHGEAQLLIYECYLDGNGVMADLAKALEWFHKSAESGFAIAQRRLADFYQGTHEYIEAVKWYRKAAEQGDAIAQKNLGVFYDEGHGVPQDSTEAAKWYERAAEQGNAGAQYNLGQYYLRGTGVASDETEGVAWLEKALDTGFGMAGFALGNHFGLLSPLPDYAKAVKYHERAIELGYERGAGNLANILDRLSKADESPEIQKAAEHCDAAACYEMGQRCLEGLGVAQNATEAFGWFQMAAELGDDADAWAQLGYLLEIGLGAPRDLAKAIEHYRRASDLGHDGAYSKLVELKSSE